MKKTAVVFLSVHMLILTTSLFAEDIKNGWSGYAKIEKMSHDTEHIFYQLAKQNNGCGDAQLWLLPVLDSTDNKAMRSLLYSLYSTGKQLSLKCEHGLISALSVLDKELNGR